MRWSSELAMEADERKSQLGVEQLSALANSELLGGAEKAFVDAALESALADVVVAIEDVEQADGEIAIVGRPEPQLNPQDDGPSIPSMATTDEGALDG